MLLMVLLLIIKSTDQRCMELVCFTATQRMSTRWVQPTSLLPFAPFFVPSPSLPTVLPPSLLTSVPPYCNISLSFLPPPSPSFPSLPLPLPRGSACDDHYHRLRLAPTGRRRLQTKSVHRFYISPVNILFVCRHVSSPYTTNTSSGL